MHLKIVDLVVGSTVSTSRQVFRGLRRSRGSTVMTGFTLSRHLLGTWETITLYCRLEEILWNTWEKYFETLRGNTMNKYFERLLYQYQLLGTWEMITLYCWEGLERRVWERKSWRMPIDLKLCGNANNSIWMFYWRLHLHTSIIVDTYTYTHKNLPVHMSWFIYIIGYHA